MRLGLASVGDVSDELAATIRSLGGTGVQLWPSRHEPPDHWTDEDIAAAKESAAKHELEIEALAMHFYPRAMLGLPGRDEQIADCIETVKAMGRAGIRVLGYDWNPNGVWRTTVSESLGGGVMTNGFDLSVVEAAGAVYGNRLFGLETVSENYLYSNPEYLQVLELADDDVVDEDRMWANYKYFLDAVLPVAEDNDVLLAVHPDDPPTPMLGGIARILWSPDHYRKAMQMADSSSWGVLLCLGTVSEMAAPDPVMDMIRTFGPEGKIGYVHFRDVEGTVPRFRETYLGRGNYEPLAVMRALRESGYNGFVMDDHVPEMPNDGGGQPRSHAWAMGYIQALIQATDDGSPGGR